MLTAASARRVLSRSSLRTGAFRRVLSSPTQAGPSQAGPSHVEPPSQAAFALALRDLKYLEHEELRARFDACDVTDDAIAIDDAQRLLSHRCGERGEASERAASAVAAHLGAEGDGRVRWESLKAAVDAEAAPVDSRVMPIYGSLTLTFVAQGIQFPVLPQLARSLSLSTAEIGLLSSATALSRIALNVRSSRRRGAIAADRVC